MASAFPLAAVKFELNERRDRQRETWRTHKEVKAFFRDWIARRRPNVAREMADCRMAYRLYESKSRDDRYKVTAYACNKRPWCIPCTVLETRRRVWRVENEWSRFTPKGAKPRGMHAVFTAPLTDSGEGWGNLAMNDVGTFMRVVKDALEAFFGPGIGGWMNYQDFGERPFSKRHPHVDLMLNGYAFRDGRIVELEGPDFKGTSERERLSLAYDGATALFGMDLGPGNSYVSPMKEGYRTLRGAFAYSLRELVDLRKIVYEAKQEKVGWQSYRDRTVDWMRAARFWPWHEEYRARVRPDAPHRIHRAFGYMWHATREGPKYAKSLGFSGEARKHAPECSCNECDDWERVVDSPELAEIGVDLWRP